MKADKVNSLHNNKKHDTVTHVLLYVLFQTPAERIYLRETTQRSNQGCFSLVSSPVNGLEETIAEAAAAAPACCTLSFQEGRDRVKTMAKYPLHVLPALWCDYRRWHPPADTRVLCSH